VLCAELNAYMRSNIILEDEDKKIKMINILFAFKSEKKKTPVVTGLVRQKIF
jgi:hypothetical protein